eukprot:3586657-Rhodomonas_salina.2
MSAMPSSNGALRVHLQFSITVTKDLHLFSTGGTIEREEWFLLAGQFKDEGEEDSIGKIVKLTHAKEAVADSLNPLEGLNELIYLPLQVVSLERDGDLVSAASRGEEIISCTFVSTILIKSQSFGRTPE